VQLDCITFFGPYCAAFILMVLLWRFWPKSWGIVHLGILSIVLRAAVCALPASDDVARYIWEGRIQNSGYNPYDHAPSDPRLASLRDENWSRINHKNIAAVYGPLAELGFRICASINRSALFFKAVFVLFDLGTLFFLILLARTWSMEIRHVALYALNPLVLFFVAGQGHLESVMVFWIAGMLYFLRKQRFPLMFLFLGMALAIKLSPLFLLPFVANRKNVSASPFVALPLALYIPYASHGIPFLNGPVLFATEFHFNGLVSTLLSFFLPGHSGLWMSWFGFAIVLGLIYLFTPNSFRAVYYATCAFVIFVPTLHPWYLMLLTPFLVFYRSTSWIVLHLTISAALFVQFRYAHTGLWYQSWYVWFIEYLPFAGCALINFLSGNGNDPARYVDPRRLSIIIPTFNEKQNIRACIDAVPKDPEIATEIIAVDGGSTDGTVEEMAKVPFVTVVHSPLGRGIQIAKGVQSAAGDVILVLHADSRPGPAIISMLVRSLRERPDASGGSFRARYGGSRRRYALTAWLNNMRTLVTGISFGDQGQFFRRGVIGDRFPALKLMEDIELSFVLKESGSVLFLPCTIENSPRKWENSGYIRNFLTVVRLSMAYVVKRKFALLSADCTDFYARYYRQPNRPGKAL
jgi:hypothetical protein